MAAPNGYPSWAYNSAGQTSLIVASLTAFNALPTPGTWSATPFPPVPPTVPTDPGFVVLDTRMQQVLVEARAQSAMMAQAFQILDDPQTVLRPDIVANDSSLTS